MESNDNGFGGDEGKTKLAMCNEISRYIKDNNDVRRTPESVRSKIASLPECYKKTSDWTGLTRLVREFGIFLTTSSRRLHPELPDQSD